MAFIKGEALEAHIERGPLPLKDALEIGRQIAEGLEAAHEEGVVHRDIKPANIMVDAKGRATIIDFGLAHLTEASRLTKTDQTMGTVAYMSPEQAQGMEVDNRSDVWALGVVLYEMVCGQRPFQGQYDQALLYEIVHQEPEPLTGVRAGVPMELEFIVGKCLAKDRNDRPSSAEEIARDLRTLGEKLKSGRSTILHTGIVTGPPAGSTQPPGQVGSASPPHPLVKYRVIENLEQQDDSIVYRAEDTQLNRSVAIRVLSEDEARRAERKLRRKQTLLLGLVVLSVVVASTIAALWMTATPPAPSPTMFTITGPEGVSFESNRGQPVVSPDGRSMAFLGSSEGVFSQLWVRRLGSLEARPLPGTTGARYPFWSPDSRHLGFFADGKLKRINLAGGSPVELCDVPSARGGAWGESAAGGGVILVGSRRSGLRRISASGGELTPATTLDEERGERGHRFPYFLPDGRRFLYLSRNSSEEETPVFLGSLDIPRG